MITIPQGHVAILERWGQFSRILEPGLNFYNPILDNFKYVPYWQNEASKENYLIEMTEQQVSTPVRLCQTQDNVTLQASTSIAWRIIDPTKAVYETDILPIALHDLALNALRSNIGTFKLDELLSQKQRLSERILGDIQDIAKEWGVLLKRVEIQELNYSEETATAMMQEMTAERKKRAMVAEAEGKKQALMILTSAKIEALQLETLAEVNYFNTFAHLVGTEKALDLLKLQKEHQSLAHLSENPAHKLFYQLPIEARTTLQ